MASSDDIHSFTPIPNPFITGVPVRDPNRFFGREEDFAYARQRLMTEREGIVLLFAGERRSGKTSILFQILAGRLGEEFLPVFVDMQQLAGTVGDREFFSRLADFTLEGATDERLVRDYYDFSQGNPLLTFDQLLDDVHRVFPDRRLVFLVDEAELLKVKVQNEELSGAVLTYMASILESRQVSFCFTGSYGLSEGGGEDWRRLIGKARSLTVSFLGRDDTLRLIQEPVEGRVFYKAGVVDAIYDLTHGHPFYTQIVCSMVVDYLNGVQRDTLVMEDLDEVIRTIVDSPPPHLVYAWDERNQDEKFALSLLSEESDQAGTPVSPEGLLQAIKQNDYPLNLRSDALHVALESLYTHRVLGRTEEGGYYFRVDLFRQWIRQARSMWRLVGEAEPRKEKRGWWIGVAAAVAIAAVAGLGGWLSRAPEQEQAQAQAQQASVPALPPTGDIWVESDPSDVIVLVDGSEGKRRVTPTMLRRLKPGPHTVELRRENYHPWSQTVAVKAGEIDSLIDVRLQRIMGFLSVTSQPAETRVQVRGEKDTSSVTPLDSLVLPTGVYAVQISKKGYVSQDTTLTISDGTVSFLDFELQANVGHVTLVSNPPDARIFLNGKELSVRTPETLDSLDVGRHKFRLQLKDYQTRDTTVSVRRGEEIRVSVALVLKPAILDLRSDPLGAKIFVDDADTVLGLTPYKLSLEPGQHRIMIEMEGYDAHLLARKFLPGEEFKSEIIKLEMQYGWVRFVNFLSGTIVIDESQQKEVPPGTIRLQVGTHTLRALTAQKNTTVTVVKDDTVKVSLE